MPYILTILKEKFGSDSVLTPEEAAARQASYWKPGEPLQCLALLRPASVEELSQMMRLCHEHEQAVVPRGGLTGVVGGVDTRGDEIALSLERMNAIEDINIANKTARVQAGVILQNLHNALAEKGLLFPLDLGAKGSCTIGGNIASNAGGLQALRYGVMRNLVLGVEAVLADGTVISSMNKMLKNNAGYDLKHLFIGTEGTLGIITRAVLKLEDAPKSRQTAYVALDSFEKAIAFLQLAKRQLNNNLTSYELLWKDYYRLMTSAPSPFAPPLPQHYPYYVLVEALGHNPGADQVLFEDFLAQTLEAGMIKDAVLAQSQQELSWFWGIRENIELIFSVHQPVFLFDVSMAIADMELYVKTIEADLRRQWPDVFFYAFGHIGDGNLHLFVSCGHADQATKRRVDETVYEPLRQIGGSISGEHGIGLDKKPYLHLSRTLEEIALMKTLKMALDPKGILNPGKVV